MSDPSFGELLLRLALLAVVLNLVVFAPLAFVASEILERRNLPAIILGVLMGPVGLILIGFLEPRHATRCPYCYGAIR